MPATLDCPQSVFYQPVSEDPEAGSIYALNEAFGECATYQMSDEPDGIHVQICQEGECIPPQDIVDTVCGTGDAGL